MSTDLWEDIMILSHLPLGLSQERDGFIMRVVGSCCCCLASLDHMIQSDSQFMSGVPHLHHESVHLCKRCQITLEKLKQSKFFHGVISISWQVLFNYIFYFYF